MKCLKQNLLYFIGFALLISAGFYFNWQIPPNLDEARAWNIAKYLTPFEIFTISKIEGHPFLWYYVLMPIAKTNFFYPYSLYILNSILIIISFYFLYKYAPIPTYIKYFITLSAPFLQLYSYFSRSYTLTILLLFTILSLYNKRHNKQFLYLSLIILLANTNTTGFFAAFSLGVIYFFEIATKKQSNKNKLLVTINFMLLEAILLIIQFYGFNQQIPQHTPKFDSLYNNLNQAFSPIYIWGLIAIYISTILVFYLRKNFSALFFLLTSSLSLFLLLKFIHQGGAHHYYFFYIYIICSYWLANTSKKTLGTKQFIPLTLISFALIFNTTIYHKNKNIIYLNNLRDSAQQMNNLFQNTQQEIIIFEDFNANIILPYLNSNITLLNQTTTKYNSLKGFEEFLFYLYKTIDAQKISNKAKKNPKTLIFYTCEEKSYYNSNMIFNLQHKLNNKYCLYNIKLK